MPIRDVAVLGLGSMGSGMAARLLEAGFGITVWNRTAARAAPLAEKGAVIGGSAAEAAAGAEVVLLSLADESAVEEVVFGQALPAARPGTLIVDTSTVSPAYSRRATRRIAAAGARRVEACVLGNPLLARSGGLRVLVAGDEPDVRRARPVLEALGREIYELGQAGRAAAMKLAFNLLLGAQLASLAEAVSYGESAGLDRDLLLTAIAESGFSSMVMSFRAELMRERRYTPPAFRSRLMEKDLRLVLGEAALANLRLPITESAADQFAELVGQGAGDRDAAAVCELFTSPQVTAPAGRDTGPARS
ncbi:NAD(P)-dependent oxidoreductase [Nonomuraea sediminis]|uniref:NAD(P)-dependent oxidoreductase n=1 Tax=Nonomuraea sediminis TaxID=2835864 RepID=UPI001BDC7792|nr:NAD(P)-dependent oxidoreductase [Nonomuraea sediminis]